MTRESVQPLTHPIPRQGYCNCSGDENWTGKCCRQQVNKLKAGSPQYFAYSQFAGAPLCQVCGQTIESKARDYNGKHGKDIKQATQPLLGLVQVRNILVDETVLKGITRVEFFRDLLKCFNGIFGFAGQRADYAITSPRITLKEHWPDRLLHGFEVEIFNHSNDRPLRAPHSDFSPNSR